jgi:hypothetical protein
MARCQATQANVETFFNRCHGAKRPTAHLLTDGTLQSSFLTDGTCQAPNGSFFIRWHAAKPTLGHFTTDGTLPSTQRDIFQPMARC